MPGQPRTRAGMYGKSGPPAPKGHRYGVIHGGQVTDKSYGKEMKAKEEEIRDLLAESAPVRERGRLPRADQPAIALLARDLVRHDLMTEYLYSRGLFDERGNITPVMNHLHALSRHITHVLAQMGMTPTARAKLGLDLVKQASFAEAMSEPNRKKRMKLLNELGVVEGEEIVDD